MQIAGAGAITSVANLANLWLELAYFDTHLAIEIS